MSREDDVTLVRERLRSVVILRSSLGTGSGFYVSNTGLIVTNRHVVGPLLVMDVQRHDRSTFQARVVRVSPRFDVAVLWDQTVNPHPPALTLAEPGNVSPGQTVFAIGHPVGLEYTVTRGIISSTDRQLNGAYHLQTDAASHPGSSGGPVLNTRGEVVGVSTLGMRAEGLNFALSVRYVHDLVGEIMVKPGGKSVRKCPQCGASNLPVRRGCRKCGAELADVPLTEERPTVEMRGGRPSAVPSEPGASSAPESVPGQPSGGASRPPGAPRLPAPNPDREPAVYQIVRALSFLEPPPDSVEEYGSVVEVLWNDGSVTVTVFSTAEEPYLTATAFVADVPQADAESLLRRALEMNLGGTLEAKLGLRGSQLYVSAERALQGLDDPEVRTLVTRVAQVRRRFLAQLARPVS